MIKQQIIILGAGGHAKVLACVLVQNSENLLGFVSPDANIGKKVFLNNLVIGDDEIIAGYSNDEILLVNGIGHMPGRELRRTIFEQNKASGFSFTSVIHSNSDIAQDCVVGEGAQIMSGSVLQPGVSIGINVIVNTGANIDHDTIIGNHCHIAPGVTVCGDVTIGDNCFIGAGATIIQGINVGKNSVIAAGAIVTKDICPNQIYKR